jgi:Flp pilus assembly pilin Flp
MTPHRSQPARRAQRRQRGAAALEWALVLPLLVVLVLGVVDLGRWLAAAGSLHEAARMGARLAVVCDLDDPQVSSRALARVVGLHALAQAPVLTVSREPAGCTSSNCQRLRVSLSGAAMQGVMPAWGSSLPLPAAVVELPRESLSSQINGRNNPSCL